MPTPFATAADGVLSYNGWVFPPAVNVSVQGRPIPDSTGRRTKYVAYSLTAEVMLYPGVDTLDAAGDPREKPLFPDDSLTTDVGLSVLRRILSEQGKELKFVQKGFGNDLSINTGVSDVAFGPRPTIIRWEPVGGNKAVRLVWGVEFAIPECGLTGTIQNFDGQVTEFFYETDFSIDESGFTTITYSGAIESAARLRGNTSVVTADFLRDRLNITLHQGFQRTQHYRLSADQRTIQFTVIDKEIHSEEPYHEGIVQSDVSHNISSVGSFVMNRYLVTMSGSFRVAAGFDKGRAWAAFLATVKPRRLAALRANLFGGQDDGRLTQTRLSQIAIPAKLSITDEVFGRGMQFALSWWLFSTYQTLLKDGGLFAPNEPRITWESYHRTMKDKPWRARGYANVRPSSGGRLNSLCDPAYNLLIHSTARKTRQRSSARVFSLECPPKESSYIRYAPEVELLTDHKSITLHPTGGFDAYSPQGPEGKGNSYGNSSGGSRVPLQEHTQGNARFRVRFRGSAVRLGYKIPQVELTTYGGARVSRPIGEGSFRQWSPGESNGCRIWVAIWDRTYELYSAPQGDLIETNPDFSQYPRD